MKTQFFQLVERIASAVTAPLEEAVRLTAKRVAPFDPALAALCEAHADTKKAIRLHLLNKLEDGRPAPAPKTCVTCGRPKCLCHFIRVRP